MALRSALAAIGDERYVVLTTFRRTGVGVATPVWIARDGDVLVVVTTSTTGKAKRLRNDPRVTLVPSSSRGAVPDGAVPVEARATIESDPARFAAGIAALQAKYGLLWTVLIRILGRRRAAERVILRIE